MPEDGARGAKGAGQHAGCSAHGSEGAIIKAQVFEDALVKAQVTEGAILKAQVFEDGVVKVQVSQGAIV